MAAQQVDLEAYEPDLPEGAWTVIRPFVLEVTTELSTVLTYTPAFTLSAVARHVDWCVNVAGIPMTRDAIFRRDVIAAGVAVMDTTKSSSRGRRRSLLLRAGEALEIIKALPPLPPLAAASPATPYTGWEIDAAIRWSEVQEGVNGRSARALIDLGFGAGLASRDLVSVRAVDVGEGGAAVALVDRTVPVTEEWREDLSELAATAEDRTLPLFRPGVAWHKNIVKTFIDRSMSLTVHLTTQRMRATWLVDRLANGVPMQDLLAAAGLKSMDALVRYERFLPPPLPELREGTPR